MRGRDFTQTALFSTKPLNRRIPHQHPLRKLRVIVDTCLRQMDADFEVMYDRHAGRESIPPEQLVRALLIQMLFSVRSERQLMEQMDYNLLFRWFVGLEMDQDVWHHSTFSANRERLLQHEVIRKFFEQVVRVAGAQGLMSDAHFSVDGTLIEALGSIKSVVPRTPLDAAVDAGITDASSALPAQTQASAAPAEPTAVVDSVASITTQIAASETASETSTPRSLGRNRWVDFKGSQRSNATHVSDTDPEAMLACKGSHQTVKLSYTGHVLMENRSGLVVDMMLTRATGRAECEAAEVMAARSIHRKNATLGADKGYDQVAHVAALKARGIRSHAARNRRGRRSAIDGRTARSKGYAASQKFRKRIEESFGWMKVIGLQRKSKFFGKARTEMGVVMAAVSYNLVRMMSLFGWRKSVQTAELRPQQGK